MLSPIISPPQLRLPDGRRDRHTTWLETFYDLVFAVAVSSLGSRLSGNISLLGVIQFVGLFLIVWWVWLGHTVYDTRFDTDDLIQRLFTFGIMLAAAAMAALIPKVFSGYSAEFALAYIVARLCLLTLYIRARWYVKEARNLTSLYLIGFGVGVALWGLSLIVASPMRYALWTLGLAIDLITPWLGQRVLRLAPLDTSHLPERLALFTIIVLGEIIGVVVMAATEAHLQTASLVAAALAFCVTVCIWWVYFTFLEAAPFVNSLGPGQPYIYSHTPIMIGLTLIGIGLSRAVIDASAATLQADTRWLIGIGMLLWLLGGLLLKGVSIQAIPPLSLVVYHGAIIAATLLLMSVGSNLAPLVLLAILALLWLIFVIVYVQHWRRWARKGQDSQITTPQEASPAD